MQRFTRQPKKLAEKFPHATFIFADGEKLCAGCMIENADLIAKTNEWEPQWRVYAESKNPQHPQPPAPGDICSLCCKVIK